MLAEKYGCVTDHAYHFAGMGFFDDSGDLCFVFFIFEIDIFHLDQFVGRQCVIDGTI